MRQDQPNYLGSDNIGAIQCVRLLGCFDNSHAGGHRFESCRAHHSSITYVPRLGAKLFKTP